MQGSLRREADYLKGCMHLHTGTHAHRSSDADRGTHSASQGRWKTKKTGKDLET